MPQITPCLWFAGQAEEAATFYTSVFKNSRIVEVSRYGEAGPGTPGKAMAVTFELDGQPFTALNDGPGTFNESISFQVSCADQAEVDEYWERFTSDGGEEGQCAWLRDRFGVSWQIVPTRLTELLSDPDPARSQRAVQAMLGMRKIDIAAMEAAADGTS